MKFTDTVSLNIVTTDDSVKELNDMFNSKEFYITPDGEITHSANTDTLEFIMKHMTQIPKEAKISTESIDENNIPSKYKPLYNDKDLKPWYYVTIEGYVYKITEEGKKIREMKPFITRDGYVEYVLTRENGKKAHIQGQRIVALAYLGKPKGKNYQVNHKDGNRKNNHLDNLEWVTPSENIRHSFDKLGKVVWNSPKRKQGKGGN